MQLLTRGRMRTAASALTAGALAAAALTFAGSPAQADEEVAPLLNWNISQQYINHFTAAYGPGTGGTLTASDGAAFADGNISWEFGGTTDAGDETTIQYHGDVTGVFSSNGNALYGVAVSDPKIVFDASGAGEIRATVSGGETGAETTPAEVTVAEFEGATIDADKLTVTPTWDGVLPAGSEKAVELEIPDGKPIDGKSFHPEFLSNLTPGVRAHFYLSSGAAETKRPAAIDARLAAPTASVTPTVTSSVKSANPADGLALQIQGTDFTAGSTGVYVGIAPADVEIDWNDAGSQDAFIGINWVSAAQFDEGGTSFTTLVNVPAKKLKKGTDYVIHTARAHGLPDRTQDTVTPVAVPFDKLTPKKVKPVIKLAKKPTSKKKGKATISIKTVAGWKAAQGKVKITLKKGKATKKVNGKLNKAGKVTVKLPKLAKGTWKITAKYAGDKSYKVATKAVKVKIKK